MKHMKFKNMSVLLFGIFLLVVSFIAMIAGFTQGNITMGTVFIILMFISLLFIGGGIAILILSRKKEEALEAELSRKAFEYSMYKKELEEEKRKTE